jgi:hypothetical protein
MTVERLRGYVLASVAEEAGAVAKIEGNEGVVEAEEPDPRGESLADRRLRRLELPLPTEDGAQAPEVRGPLVYRRTCLDGGPFQPAIPAPHGDVFLMRAGLSRRQLGWRGDLCEGVPAAAVLS